MNTKKLLLTSLIACTIGLGNMAYASPDNSYAYQGQQGQHFGKKRQRTPEQRIEKMAKRLGLSDSQKQQIKILMEGRRAKMQALHQQMRASKQSLRTLDPSAYDFSSRLNNLADEQANLTRQIVVTKGQSRQQIFNLLTAEQRTKMKAMHAKRTQKRQERSNHYDN